jgi:hypothetical protein
VNVCRRRPRPRSFCLAIVIGSALSFGNGVAAAAPDANEALTPERVLGSLNQTLAWYQQARVAMQSVDDGSGFADTREDRQTAVAILQRAFDVARAEAAALVTEPSAAPSESSTRGGNAEAELQARIRQDEQTVRQLSTRARTALANQRSELERQAAAARNRLELARARADFVARLRQFDASMPSSTQADLSHQIQALQDGVPGLRTSNAPAPTAPASRAEPVVGTWPLIHRLVTLNHARSTLDDLARATSERQEAVERDRQTAQASVRPLFARLRTLADNPGASGDLAADEREFHEALDRGQRLAAVVAPAREESALLRRYGGDLQEWRRAIDSQGSDILRGIMLELLHVAIAVGVILVGAVLWHVAVVRYVSDAYRRRLLLTARNVVVGAAVVLVITFHFTSELAALVTALGFAAAGLAFALQNIILAVVGYFTMVGPNGIRVGDRVSLQGPFSYVQGEVAEIGFVRIKLRELSGDPPQPTGRLVVFPNSVVFTGSFFKHPAPAAS